MITFEAKIQDKTVRMYAELPLKNAAGALFKVIAQISNKADVFNNKFVLCFGWAYFFLVERTDENGETFWVVQTTEYGSDPENKRTDNVTTSLIVQNMQMECVQVAGVKPEVCTSRDTVLVLKAAMDAEDIYLNRNDKAKDGDSGWYIGLTDDPDEDNHGSDDYEKIPSYQILGFCPEAMRVLQLPVGTVAVFSKKQLTALVDANDKPLRFTSEEERRKRGEKQRAEFEKEVAEAKARALAENEAADKKD